MGPFFIAYDKANSYSNRLQNKNQNTYNHPPFFNVTVTLKTLLSSRVAKSSKNCIDKNDETATFF